MLEAILTQLAPASVVPFDLQDRQAVVFDFTESSEAVQSIDPAETSKFTEFIEGELSRCCAEFGVGRYNEDRLIYRKSSLFAGSEPRSIHLGIDILAPAGTAVCAPCDGRVHSFQDNRGFGDYGPTIILEHTQGGFTWYTLYGHLSRESLTQLEEGKAIAAGSEFARFGSEQENGRWPPHLHFQIIRDLEGRRGDYPGVCAASQRSWYLKNCPDPQLLLNIRSLD